MSNNTSLEQHNGDWRDGKYAIQVLHFIILAFFIVLFNSSVIVLVWQTRILHKWQNYLLTSLAFSDLSTGVVCIPLVLLCTMSNKQSLRCTLCSISFTLTKFTSVSTVLHLLVVTYERYLFIVHPFYHERLSAKRKCFKIVLVMLWCVSLLVSSIPFAWMNITECDEEESDTKWLSYNIITIIIFLIFPIFLFVYAFISMFFIARAHIRRQDVLINKCTPGKTNSLARRHKEARVAVIFLLMWIVFIVCWGPYFVQLVFDDIVLPESLIRASNVLRVLTSLLNPILYSFMKKDFSEALRLTCCGHNNKSNMLNCLGQRQRNSKQRSNHEDAKQGMTDKGKRGSMFTQESML